MIEKIPELEFDQESAIGNAVRLACWKINELVDTINVILEMKTLNQHANDKEPFTPQPPPTGLERVETPDFGDYTDPIAKGPVS